MNTDIATLPPAFCVQCFIRDGRKLERDHCVCDEQTAELNIADLTVDELVAFIGFCSNADERKHAARILAVKADTQGFLEACDRMKERLA